MEFPKEFKYSKEHEWIAIEDGVATIGITDHAQDALGDIVYLGDLPDAGDHVDAEDVIGVVESVKATSDIFAPLSGEVTAINEDLEEKPELVNESPYGDGWILKIKIEDDNELGELMDADAYKTFVSEDD